MSTELRQRRSSGLVRAGAPFDSFAFNVFGLTVGVIAAWTLLYAVAFYPGSNVLLSIGIVFVCSIGFVGVYVLFAAIMPRSGGDYVFIGRSLHPSLGFAANASFMFWVIVYIALSGSLLGQIGLATVFRQLGEATGELQLAEWGDWFYTDWGLFLSGLGAIAILGPLLVAGRAGLKTYFSFQRVLIVFAIGTLVLTIIVILVTSRDSFVSSFDSYVGTFSGEGGSYDKIMAAGGPHGDFSFKASMQAATWPIFGMVFLAISSYWAGESKHGLRSQAIGLGLPLLVGFALLFAVVGAGMNTFGVDFLNALGLADPTEVGLGFAPYYPELAGMSAGPVLGIIMGLGLTAWLLSYIPFLSIIATRSVLAWSFDGIVPSWLSRVDSRGNPVNATIAVYAFAIVILVIYSFTDWLTVTTPLLGLAFVIGLTCVAAIVFPFRRRDLFDGSAGAVRVAGVPLLAIAGVVGVAGIGVQMFILLWDPNSGTNWPADKKQVLATMGAFVVAGGIWVISTLVQRARGIDVANSARTLPVE